MRLSTYIATKDAKSKDDLTLLQRLEVLRDQQRPEADPKTIYERYRVYNSVLDMTLAQFIYFESEIRQSQPSEQRLSQLLVRPTTEDEFDDTAPQEEAHLEQLMGEDAYALFKVINEFMTNREFVLFTRFDGVIYSRIEKTEEEPEEEDEEDKQAEFEDNWFFYKIVRTLANEDITKFSDIYSLRMSEVLVELSYRAQLSILETAKARQEEARAKALRHR